MLFVASVLRLGQPVLKRSFLLVLLFSSTFVLIGYLEHFITTSLAHPSSAPRCTSKRSTELRLAVCGRVQVTACILASWPTYLWLDHTAGRGCELLLICSLMPMLFTSFNSSLLLEIASELGLASGKPSPRRRLLRRCCVSNARVSPCQCRRMTFRRRGNLLNIGAGDMIKAAPIPFEVLLWLAANSVVTSTWPNA